jgi:DNA-binding transcriptional MocR family regulator
VEASHWAKLLGSWTDHKGPLHRRLSTAIRSAIEHGLLLQGTRLPSERDLAAALHVSRNTVVAAYNALRDEGWLESGTGKGTWTRREFWAMRDAQEEIRMERIAGINFLGVLDVAGTSIDFATGTPYPLRGVPAEALSLTAQENEQLLNTRLYYPFGLPALRQAIASRYSAAGLETAPDSILVTGGAQQAIALIGILFLQRGDSALIEDPCYFGALESFRVLGARLHSLPVGHAGVEPHVFRDLCTATSPRLAYLTPTFQNPTGTVMPAADRREIVQLAAQRGLPLIDDRTLADIRLDPENPLDSMDSRSLAAWDTSGTVLTVGSLGKLLWAGLRIGWIRAARHLIEPLVRLKMANDLGTALPTQRLAVKLLRFYEEARAMRASELSVKRNLMVSLLRNQLPDWEFAVPTGGLFLWIKLPRGDSNELAQVALRHRLILMPGSNMSAEQRHGDRLRIPFLLERDELREGVRRLVAAWADYTRGDRPRLLEAIT